MLFIPVPKLNAFLRKLSPVLLLPNLFIFIGSMLFLATLPFVAEQLYGNVVYRVCQGLAWGLAGISIIVTIIMQLARESMAKSLNRHSVSEIVVHVEDDENTSISEGVSSGD